MERFRPVSITDGWHCAPLPTAQDYGEQVSPAPKQEQRPHPASVQLYPAPEPSTSSPINREAHLAALRARVEAPYRAGEQDLCRLQKRLRRTSSEGEPDEDPPLQEATHSEIIRFPTEAGALSFEELYASTRGYVAAILNRRFGIPFGKLDDCLQAAYLTLWRRLHDTPDALADKGKPYIAIRLIYDALHALKSDWRYAQHIDDRVGQVSNPQARHSHDSRQSDLRADLHQAIAQVADTILSTTRGKRTLHDLWALYGLTMLQVHAGKMSELFTVRKQSMQAAYHRVQEQLRTALPGYAPRDVPTQQRRCKRGRLPQEDLATIRQSNRGVGDALYDTVARRIADTPSDTQHQDSIALVGIRHAIPIMEQARRHGIPASQMQRAYTRVHLLIGAERDPTIRARRPDRRMAYVFTLTDETQVAIEQLALTLLQSPKSYEKLVALHTHISNLPVSTTAKHFNIPTSTLRFYVKQIGEELGTPTQSNPWKGRPKAGEGEIKDSSAGQHQPVHHR